MVWDGLGNFGLSWLASGLHSHYSENIFGSASLMRGYGWVIEGSWVAWEQACILVWPWWDWESVGL